MATLSQVRADLAERLETIPGLYVYPYIPESLEWPACVVGMPERVEYTLTYGPTGLTWQIPVRLYAARFDAETAQQCIDSYVAAVGSQSIRAALEDGTSTPSSSWHFVKVVECRDFGAYRIADVDYVGCELLVEVVTT